MSRLWSLVPLWLRIAGPIVVVLVVVGLIVTKINHTVSTIKREAATQAVQQIQIKAQSDVLENVEISHEAVQQITQEAASGSGSHLYGQCLRSARNPQQCERYKPVLPGR